MRYLFIFAMLVASCGDPSDLCPCDCEYKNEKRDDCDTGYVFVCYACDKWDACYQTPAHCKEISDTEQCCVRQIDPCFGVAGPTCW